ncbi:MipA/OmpV family protein [Sphingomonas sp.]|uniref:MipA/OmpV family protein n=1 Tax=Sphingomonas sp. TaxID=28214 RepID=UPI003D6D4FD9
MTYPSHIRLSLSGPRFIVATAMLSLIFWGASAQAQEQEQESGKDKDHIVIGIGAGYAPAYQGSDKYRVLPVPVIDVAWGPFFANLQNGVGINAIDTDHITIGASVTVMQGYRSKDAPDGIGKLSFGAGGRGFVNLKAAGFVATIGATKGFAGSTKGLIADASLSYPITVSPRLTLVPTIGTTWADKKHNDRFYGVNSKQSFASGLPQFRPGSGFNDASFMLSAQYRLTDRISLGAAGGATTLLGKVQDSPIVFHKTQPLGFLSIAYRFGR